MVIKTLMIAAGLLCAVRANATERVYVVTAYCACKECCGQDAYGYTASGRKPIEGITIAAPRSIPFGTKMFIDGVGHRVVHDRLANRYDTRIDVYMTDHNRAKQFGKKRLTVKYF
jgi:3D (Asp-Asp-Asp) domain-containing protein